MGQVILIRHGQANTGARTEEEYDRLSDTGRQQSEHLGDYLRSQNIKPDVFLCGTLNRHHGTVAGIGDLDRSIEVDARLNELDYLTLGRALETDLGVPQPGPDEFLDHFIKVLQAWKATQISGQESYDSFETRVAGVLEEACQPGKLVVCVTSGGVIAMMLRHLLRLDVSTMARVALPIWNTSMHRIAVSDKGAIMTSFNEIPHLDDSRAALRTCY